MLKRTMLDMEGVFSVASSWVDREPLADGKLVQAEATVVDSKQLGLDSLDADLRPSEIDLIMTGKPQTSLSAKKFSDSILFDLSEDDRDMLEKMNHA